MAVNEEVGVEPGGRSVRTSVTLPRELYETLGQIAKNGKVTVAWVIRDAAENYVAEKWPLLAKGKATRG